MITFDLSSLMSLCHCKQWLDEGLKSNNGPLHIFLVGTKRDLLVKIEINILKNSFFLVLKFLLLITVKSSL